MKQGNPWGLTPAEERAMDAVCEHGSQKVAAYELRLSLKTVENQCSSAGRRMGGLTMLQRYLLWDRFRRGER